MRLRPFVFVSVYLLVGYCSALNPCAPRKFNQDSVVCVCNTTYCDDFEPIGVVPNSGVGAQFTSSRDGFRFMKTNITTTNSVPANAVILSFNPTVRHQKIFGFGGAITDAAGINLNSLPPDLADNVIKQYYSYPNGIGYSTARIPIASCDFSTHPYSYSDVDGDFNLTNFNLTTEDFTLKLPYLKKALTYTNSTVRFFGSPWSAPGWMKETGLMRGGGPLKGPVNGQYYQTWANYFVKFIQAYMNQGIQIWGVTLQNEPNTGRALDFPWQTMYWNASMQRDFLRDLLGPMLDQNFIWGVKKIILDDNRGNLPDWADTILADPNAAKFVDMIGVHWYEDETKPASNLNDTYYKHPGVPMLYTEACAGWEGDERYPLLGNWTRAEQYADDILTALNNYVTGWNDWNIVLDVPGGPNWVGNTVDSSIIVNANTSEYYKQPLFFAMGHFSRFVRPNAVRVNSQLASSNPSLEFASFVNPDNTRVTVILNKDDVRDLGFNF
ncbi:hypothetical protein WR25_13263 isoform C [Diploscapter pachys]|uniref:Glucosylceramidase n=2 Tax=Diploscapter pachys TaxID=2018661 RepID=A0A2A2LWL4_9BILA|nr:hypothetical protein WR25_13263 isoform C [Diploscapter pachys]